MKDECPICGSSEAHEHIISNALPPGNHMTYEELMITKKPDFAAWCAEERKGGAGGCGACVLCCSELKKELERYELSPPTFAELSNLQDENEDLAKENARIHKVKDMVLRERQTMETRCSEMSGDIEDFKRWNSELKESIIAILRCASEGGPDELAATLGLIRIECNRVLGNPGSQAVTKLSDTMFSTDELMEQIAEYMNRHTYGGTKSGPCCPPGRCKDGADPLKCSRWQPAQVLAPEDS